jgi:hypothetical protein
MSLLALALLCCPCAVTDGGVPAGKPFRITVVDEQTDRGVPLVELTTVNSVRLVTDSNGIVAFHEPGLMGQKVFFHVKSHGYEFPKDGFGFRGRALDVKEGGSAVLKIKRLNVAERLYRVTGAGIYRDSVLAGAAVPLERPLLNAQVFGSDSVLNVEYRGKLYWFWGDTNRAAYPLGNYEVPGATSALPGQGGLDPRAGVNLNYFLDEKGFARRMTAVPGKGPTWITSLVVLRDGDRERLFAVYVKVRGSLDIYARGLAEFDDRAERFERVTEFDLKAAVQPGGHTFLRTEGGVSYVYFASPYPLVRVRATPADLTRQASYEAFTCLKQGSRLEKPELDRGPDGAVRYGWKTETPPLTPEVQARLLKQGLLKPGEALTALQDADTGAAVRAHSGSVYWNAYRQRWVMIAVQLYGTSLLGEVWYAEADTPLGPWAYARKVVTHERYSFYNPKQHPMFDRDGGRTIFFEGTYTHTFSGNNDQTPRYDYNQIMYQLDLADSRLVLPVPVYALSGNAASSHFGTRPALGEGKRLPPVAFFALDRPRADVVPVYAQPAGMGRFELRVGKPGAEKTAPVFYALPPTATPPSTAVPLHAFVHEQLKETAYAPASWSSPGFVRAAQPLCFVWRAPQQIAGGWDK